MIVIQNEEIEKGIIIALKPRNITRNQVEENLNELEKLAETAGAKILFRVIQEKDRKDSAYYIGKGKAEDLAQLVEINDIAVVIFDDDLNPTQVRNLEKLINRKIIDRSGLILDIFALHAKTKEAKTQVELAQLQYMLPRLTRAWTHLSKQYGGIGTKGPGETQIETDRRIIRTRISKLKEKLTKMESQQLTKSLQQNKFLTATLVGYTNAGKSTLINLLTKADVLVEDKLFATLDSVTRLLILDKNKSILLTDTVGFIRKLPHNLVASFKSTLNVIKQADLILHVIDMSYPFFEDQIEVVNKTLEKLNCDKKPIFKIFNKVDLLQDKDKIDYVKNHFSNSLIISAARGINVSQLINKLARFYEKNFIDKKITLHVSNSKLISFIHSNAEVISTKYEDESIIIKFRADITNYNKIKRKINESTKINT